MANNQRTKVLQFPSRRRSYEQLRATIEVQQFLIDVLCWAKPNPVHMLTQKQRRRVDTISRRTGLSHQTIMRQAAGLWMDVEAPVYMN